MTLQRLCPRLLPSGYGEIPVFPNGRSPRPLAWLVIVFAALPAFLAVAVDATGFRLVMASLAVTLVVIGVSLLMLFGAISPRVVSVDDAAHGLRFVPRPAATVPMVVIPAALLLPALARLIADLAHLPTVTTSLLLTAGPYALGALGVGLLVLRIVQLRVPAGLELTTEGVRGIRGREHIDWPWEDVAQVSVVAAPAAKLSLVPASGRRPVLSPALALGSDPNLVAAIVRFYLERPAERPLLEGDGIEALRRVEAALRP